MNRIERDFAIGRAKLAAETNIIEFIRSRRIVNAAVKILLSKELRKRLHFRSQFLTIKEKEANLDVEPNPNEVSVSVSDKSSGISELDEFGEESL